MNGNKEKSPGMAYFIKQESKPDLFILPLLEVSVPWRSSGANGSPKLMNEPRPETPACLDCVGL